MKDTIKKWLNQMFGEDNIRFCEHCSKFIVTNTDDNNTYEISVKRVDPADSRCEGCKS